MSVCPKCGVEVREGKAFCYNCGEPMSQGAASGGKKPSPELFEDTVLDPPPQRPKRQQDAQQQQTPTPPADATSPAPPRRPATEREAAPTRQTPAPAAFEQAGTAKGRRRKFFYGKFGVGAVVLLLLLVVLGVLALAVLSG
jgi:hypothetical protein